MAQSFRVVPRQDRSMETVERMLAAVERLVRRSRNVDGLTLEAVALEAHVTPQAAYRYFHDVTDLIRLFARRVQTVEHEMLLAALTEQRFESEADLAETAVSFVLDACSEIFEVPRKLRGQILRDYAEICYGLLWTLAETVSSTLARRRDPCAGIGVVSLNCALVSIVSAAISLCFRGEHLVSSSRSHARMLDVFLAAIGSVQASES